MQVEVVAAATRELAEKIKAACAEESNKAPAFFRVRHSDVKEIPRLSQAGGFKEFI